jgi:predicted metal-dependent hydrolase
MENWYRDKTAQAIADRVNFYLPTVGESPTRITIKEQRKRWGSCSSLGRLNFNWRIIMLPQSVLDYIVVHELCHLVHHNHSRDFWNLVGSILSDYQECKQWLKLNGFRAFIW